MEKLKMLTPNLVQNNIEKIKQIFPNCVVEHINGGGKPELAVDFDRLTQELSSNIVKGNEERYQFTWSGKKQSILTANAPINKTLRPCREDSVDFDKTENLYIEGDNLDVLKLLRENYFGKVEMIYIDPPYNTGNDFVYEDDFVQSSDDYIECSGQKDDEGNRLVANTESNGRFHTDWLNMMYPRLKVARDLLSENGFIFISIDDNEVENLRKICDEIFGEDNFRNQVVVRRGAKSVQAQFDTWDKLGQAVEYILIYSKRSDYRFPKQVRPIDEEKPGSWNNHWRGSDRPTMRYELFGITPKSGQWRWSKDRSEQAIKNYERMLRDLGKTVDDVEQEDIDDWYTKQSDKPDLLRLSSQGKPEHYIPPTDTTLLNTSWMDLLVGSAAEVTSLFDGNKVFDTPKLTPVIMRMLNFVGTDALIMDFFSGSATTGQAIFLKNEEDAGRRKFILVQLPEVTAENSIARKNGYKTICELGEERLRRAGALIKHSAQREGNKVDVGFRVLKLDSSNMKDVYYKPSDVTNDLFALTEDNIKDDRTDEDLLFQVMLEMAVPLSANIRSEEICGKKVMIVDDDYLIACFDKDITDEVVTDIAKRKPQYFVMRDSSAMDDSVITNFETIFQTYSKDTVRKIL